MVALASSLHPGMEFRQADAEHLPFTDGTFAAVVSNFVEIRTFEFRHRLRSTDELWAAMTEGTVRTAATVSGQPLSVQRDIRAAFDDLASAYLVDGGLDVPVSFKIAVGAKDAQATLRA
jgi:hypothetical protein